MPDTFTEVSTQGWFSRLMESIKGVLIGLVLFLISFVVLFWNEGRAVKTAQSLEEGKSGTVLVKSDKVDAANENKLIHTSGEATTKETLKDDKFELTAQVLRLRRKVQFFQWKEEKKERKEKQTGGSEKTITEYTYTKDWVDKPIESGDFKKEKDHVNFVAEDVSAAEWTAKSTLGAFDLTASQVNNISKWEPVAIKPEDLTKLSATARRGKPNDGGLYYGSNPDKPEVGDVKVTFEQVKPTVISVIAQQSGNTFRPYQTKAGDALDMLEIGDVSADQMYKKAEDTNTMMTWILRLGGYLAMAIGISMLFKPLVTVADILPFFGDILNLGLTIFSGLIALPLTLVTIGVAWLAYRPVLGGALLGGALVLLIVVKMMGKKKPAADQYAPGKFG